MNGETHGPNPYRIAYVAAPAVRTTAAGRLAPTTASLLDRRARERLDPCAECSRIVTEAESPIRAFAWLVVHRVHVLEHARLDRYGDLPF